MTAHAERGPLTVRYRPGSLYIDLLDDQGEAVAHVRSYLLVDEPEALALAHQMAAAPLLFEALEKAQAVEDHELECDFCLNAPFCEIRGQMAIAAGVAREDALTAARVPDEREAGQDG